MNANIKFRYALIVAFAAMGLMMIVAPAMAHHPPSPVFSFSPDNPMVCSPVEFTRTQTDGTFDIYFGDGTNQVIETPDHTFTASHQYSNPGTYTVNLYKWIEGYWDGIEYGKCPGGSPSDTCEQWKWGYNWYHHHWIAPHDDGLVDSISVPVGCCEGMTDCEGTCCDLQTDNENCGECGNACETGFTCYEGQCTLISVDCPEIAGSIWTWKFNGGYFHTLIIDTHNPITGAVTGHGFYDADPSYTWTLTGFYYDNSLSFHILYTGTNAGYYVDAVGSFDGCEFIGGKAIDSNEFAAEWTAVPKECPRGYQLDEESGFCNRIPSTSAGPFTEAPCKDILDHANTQLTGVDVTKLPLLKLKNAAIRAEVTYGSSLDCAALTCYVGEPSFAESTDCSEVNYWNLAQVSDIIYGGGINHLEVKTPVTACQLLVVKNTPETALPVHIKVSDSNSTVGADFSTTEAVTRYRFALPDDFSACRPIVTVPK